MAIDKAVDSTVLESNLTAVADAIRAKTGGSDPMAFPSGMVEAISGIVSGSGGGAELPTAKLLCTLTAEMHIRDILAAHPIPVEYKNCIVWLKHVGDNAATIGNYTLKWSAYLIFGSNDREDATGLTSEIRCQSNGLKAPNAVGAFDTIYALNGSYFSIVNNCLTSNSSTNNNRYFGVGNSLYYICIPFDFENMTTEVEKR